MTKSKFTRCFFKVLLALSFSLSTVFAEAQVPAIPSSDSRLEADREAALAYLSKMPVIRVAVSNALTGNGHQSAAATVISGLRRLGYQGYIEVLYEASVKRRLGFLIPPFNPYGTEVQDFPDRKLRFIEDSPTRGPLSPVPLVISGASDSELNPKSLGAETLLRLQPLNWRGNEIVPANGRPVSLERFINLGYVFDLPNSVDPIAFISSEMSHIPDLASKISGLQSILSSRAHHELASAYGFGYDGPPKLAVYLGAIHQAMTEKPEYFRDGTIVNLFSNLNSAEKIKFLLYLEAQGLKDVVKIVNIRDAEALVRESKNLKKGEILLVEVGSVSKSVFEYFYSISTVVSTVSGKNGNNLMQLLGKAFLNTSSDLPFQASNLKSEGLESVARLFNQFAQASRMDPTQLRSDLARFIIDAKNPNSVLSRYFQANKISANSIQSDKLIQGLLAVKKYMRLLPKLEVRTAREQAEFNRRQQHGDYSQHIITKKIPELKKYLENVELGIHQLFAEKKWSLIEALITTNIDATINEIIIENLFLEPSSGIQYNLQVKMLEHGDLETAQEITQFIINEVVKNPRWDDYWIEKRPILKHLLEMKDEHISGAIMQNVFSRPYRPEMKDFIKLLVEVGDYLTPRYLTMKTFKQAYSSEMREPLRYLIEIGDEVIRNDLAERAFALSDNAAPEYKIFKRALSIEDSKLRQSYLAKELDQLKSGSPIYSCRELFH